MTLWHNVALMKSRLHGSVAPMTAPPPVSAVRVQSIRTDRQCEVWRGGLNWKHCVATARDLEMTVRLFFSWWGHPYVAWAAL
jgi:hypothetical protein